MSLSLRLALFASLLVIATSLVIGITLTQAATADLYSDLETRGMAIARGLADRAAPLLETQKENELQNLLESFWEEQNVAKVDVLDLRGNIIASHDLGLKPATIDNAVVMYSLNGAPDSEGFKDSLGAIRVTLSAVGVEAHQKRYVSNALRLSLGVAGVGILIAIGIGFLLALPLGRLSKTATSVAFGDYQDALKKLKALPPRSGQEVAQLAAALSHAVEAVHARENELKSVNDLLRRTEAARDSMTHMVIHDLKGPIGKVVTLMGVLDIERLDEEDQELVTEVQQRSRLLLRRIEEQLEQARSTEAELTLDKKPTSIQSLIEHALGHVDHQAQHAGFQIIQELPKQDLLVRCDEACIIRVIENLVGNAIRYGASPITISVLPNESALELVVDDAGPGVPEDKAELIFEKFQSFTPGDATKRMGSGLGLAFVKTVIEAHNGLVRVDGARFSVSLPLS